MKLKIKGALFHCGRCRKDYSNPLGHVCVSRLDRKAPAGKTRLAPKVTASAAGKCAKCGKPRGFRHTCTVRTDFKKRRAAGQKADRPQHRYEACRDDDCERARCRAFKQGREEGYQDGYADGFPDGIAACPRDHG